MTCERLKREIRQADQQGFLYRSLMQSLIDSGGDGEDLQLLLEDCKKDRKFFDDLARKINGAKIEEVCRKDPIFRATQYAFDLLLKAEDFESSAADFTALHPSLRIAPAISGEKELWSESKPKSQCKYLLHQFKEPALFDEILRCFEGNPKKEHAGWRELYAFMSSVSRADLSPRRVLAAGSQMIIQKRFRTEDSHELSPTFPIGDGLCGEKNISWKGVKREETDKFEEGCLFLIRIYE